MARALTPASYSFRVQRLQSLNANFSALQGGDSFGGSAGGGERRDGRDAGGNGRAANCFLVKVRVGAVRRIDDQLNAIGLDQIDGVRASFFDFVDAIDGETRLFQNVGGTVSGNQLESHVDEAARDFDDVRLVVIGDADEERALRRQLLSRGDLRFGKSFAEIVGDTHDFSGGAHFGAEDGVDAGKFRPGEDGRLDEETAPGIEVGAALDIFWQELAQLAAGHQAGSDFGHRDAGSFRDEGNGARGAGIDFEDVDCVFAMGGGAAEL